MPRVGLSSYRALPRQWSLGRRIIYNGCCSSVNYAIAVADRFFSSRGSPGRAVRLDRPAEQPRLVAFDGLACNDCCETIARVLGSGPVDCTGESRTLSK
jgi:hypothetical protein